MSRRSASVGKPTSSLTPLDGPRAASGSGRVAASRTVGGRGQASGTTPASRLAASSSGARSSGGGVALGSTSTTGATKPRPAPQPLPSRARVDSAPHPGGGTTRGRPAAAATTTRSATGSGVQAPAPKTAFSQQESRKSVDADVAAKPVPSPAVSEPTPARPAGERAPPAASSKPTPLDSSLNTASATPSRQAANATSTPLEAEKPRSLPPTPPQSEPSPQHRARLADASPPKKSVVASPSSVASQRQESHNRSDDRPWPTVAADEEEFLRRDAVEERGGEFFSHFEDHGFYACRRCRAPVARAESKAHLAGGYAAFTTYTVANLTCSMLVGKHFTKFNVRCKKCDANIGMLTKEASSTGDCLRMNSQSIWYTHRNPPATSVLPADSTFDAVRAQEEADESDDSGDDYDSFADELDALSTPRV